MALLLCRLAVLLSVLSYSLALESGQQFTLRHVHSTHAESGCIRWADVPESQIRSSVSSDGSSAHVHTLQTKRMRTHRPISQKAFHSMRVNARKRRREQSSLGQAVLGLGWGQSLGWEENDVEGPATDKRETLLALAKMTSNAYFRKDEPGWYDLGGNWTADHSVGWDPDVDGFRGHVFLSADNATAVLSIKGTSAGIFGGGTTILVAVREWTGLGAPCAIVTEGVANAIKPVWRSRWRKKPSTQHITHVYNTADPIAMGVCNGPASLCYIGGYALETKCHLGQTIVYDTVSALHWSVNIQAHFIMTVTEQLLNEDWSEKVRKGKRWWWQTPPDNGTRIEVPEPTRDEDCTECYTWEFGDYANKSIGR
ncbi:putative lipase atg15 [Ceratobasidium sp. 392]|nr:putative lipase atg15 [Ceratobasidium sp. 392]